MKGILEKRDMVNAKRQPQVKNKISLRLVKVEQNLSKQNMNKWRNVPLFLYCVRVRVSLNNSAVAIKYQLRS